MITPLGQSWRRLAGWSAVLVLAVSSALANTAIEPQPRDERWVKRHEGFVEIARAGGVDVLFLGDSITDYWRSKGKAVWEREIEPLAPGRVANFGISGDRTQHVLWRLQNGELEGISPKVVVLMIGTNNTGWERDLVQPRNTAAETIEGVAAVVRALRAKLPETKILLQAVFPRADAPDAEKREIQSQQIREINAGIARLADGQHVRWLDFGGKFLDGSGAIPPDIMADQLHPDEKGYEIWAAAIKEPLREILK